MATAEEKAAKAAAKAQKKANKQAAANANANVPGTQTTSPVSLPVGAKGPGLPSSVNPLIAGAINTPYWQKQYQASPSQVTAAFSPPALNQLAQFYAPQAGGAAQTTTSAADQIFGSSLGGSPPPPPTTSPPPTPPAGPPGPIGGKGGGGAPPSKNGFTPGDMRFGPLAGQNLANLRFGNMGRPGQVPSAGPSLAALSGTGK